jgi:branched-chain amino acid aminotransferase
MAGEPRYVWVDGAIAPARGTHLSAFDRGFQLGDAVFETLRARGGRVTELEQHLARLRASADGLGIALPAATEDTLTRGIDELLQAEDLAGEDGDAALRITVSRGRFHGRGLLAPSDAVTGPTIVVQAWPVVPVASALLERGLHVVTSAIRRDPSSPLGPLKTTSRADHVYARLEAQRAGADDALFLTIDGYLSEATTANVFLVSRQRLETPALDCGILAGTTREWLLGWARRVALEPAEVRLLPGDLAAADEAFLCSSVAGIVPLTRYDGRPIGDGRPGPWARRARADREAFIRDGDATGDATGNAAGDATG